MDQSDLAVIATSFVARLEATAAAVPLVGANRESAIVAHLIAQAAIPVALGRAAVPGGRGVVGVVVGLPVQAVHHLVAHQRQPARHGEVGRRLRATVPKTSNVVALIVAVAARGDGGLEPPVSPTKFLTGAIPLARASDVADDASKSSNVIASSGAGATARGDVADCASIISAITASRLADTAVVRDVAGVAVATEPVARIVAAATSTGDEANVAAV